MDERVTRAMQQWPDVPDVYGWLSLDARGRWKLRGEPITNPNLIAFINRNYARSDTGSYAFQNGPQRVHVTLDVAPWVAFLSNSDAETANFELHTGTAVSHLERVYLSGNGSVILDLPEGPALMSDQDLVAVLQFMRDADGNTLDDAALEQALADPQQLALKLSAGPGLVAIHSLPDDNLENVFSFIAQPKARR